MIQHEHVSCCAGGYDVIWYNMNMCGAVQEVMTWYDTTWTYVVLCRRLWRDMIQHEHVWCCAGGYDVIWYNMNMCRAVQEVMTWYDTTWTCVALCRRLWRDMIQHEHVSCCAGGYDVIWYNMNMCRAVQEVMTWYDTTWTCVALCRRLWRDMIQHEHVSCCAGGYDVIWYNMNMCRAVQEVMAWYDTTWTCVALCRRLWRDMIQHEHVWCCAGGYDVIWYNVNMCGAVQEVIVHCHMIQHEHVWCCAGGYCSLWYDTTWTCVVLCRRLLFTVIWYNMNMCGAVQEVIVHCDMIQHEHVWCCAGGYDVIWYNVNMCGAVPEVIGHCHMIQHEHVWCCAGGYCSLWYDTTWTCVVLCRRLLFTVIWYNMNMCGAVQEVIVHCDMIQHEHVWCCAGGYCSLSYDTTWTCVVLCRWLLFTVIWYNMNMCGAVQGVIVHCHMIQHEHVWCCAGGYCSLWYDTTWTCVVLCRRLLFTVAFLDIQRTARVGQTIVWPISWFFYRRNGHDGVQ